ncbi:unnamed protein product [Pleuronectes platessa]|uniref:Uncharacterized protein n=1 Tax=Pleuronectes platessa TaxID=8262 RepID=A0A9N7UNK1_PLEPL|nr:unnamed protein product [Pleuronectes platessa]
MEFPAPRCRAAVGWGVYYPHCQQAADSGRSQEVRRMMEGKEERGRVRDDGSEWRKGRSESDERQEKREGIRKRGVGEWREL